MRISALPAAAGVNHGAFPGWAAVFSAFLAALPGLLVIVIILGGILSGVFTATESAATAVCWALLVTGVVYRSLSWKGFLAACAKACKTTGVVLLLIGISSAFGYFMSSRFQSSALKARRVGAWRG